MTKGREPQYKPCVCVCSGEKPDPDQVFRLSSLQNSCVALPPPSVSPAQNPSRLDTALMETPQDTLVRTHFTSLLTHLSSVRCVSLDQVSLTSVITVEAVEPGGHICSSPHGLHTELYQASHSIYAEPNFTPCHFSSWFQFFLLMKVFGLLQKINVLVLEQREHSAGSTCLGCKGIP